MNEKRSRKIPQKSFTPCPIYEGPAVCVDVTDPVLFRFENKETWKFKFVFEVNLANPERDGERFAVWSAPMAETLNEKATLRKFMKSWYGRDLTPQEIRDLDLEDLVGRPAHIIVEHEHKDELTFANIQLIRPAKPGKELKPSGTFVREYQRERRTDERPAGGGGGGQFNRTAPSGAPAKPASKTSPGAAEQDPAGVEVHFGSKTGIPLSQFGRESIEKMIRDWLHGKFAGLAKPSADDKRLATALRHYEAKFAAESEPAEPAAEAEPAEATEDEPEFY